MRGCRTALVAGVVALLVATPPVAADDAVVNTPTLLSALKGEWEQQPRDRDDYKERLYFDGSGCGKWHQSARTLPVSITFYVEGNELLLQHYYEPKGAFNYRLKQLRYRYSLNGDTLTLTLGDTTETWKRLGEGDPK